MTAPDLEPAQRLIPEPTDENGHPLTECSDEPKLTAEEWAFIEAMSGGES